MIDIVYPLGAGSEHSNKELEYSMKCVEKFLKGYRNIIVVGDNPGFTGNFMHIDALDEGQNPQQCIMNKIKFACGLEQLSDNFLMINDDHFFVRPTHISDIKNFCFGNLASYYLLSTPELRNRGRAYYPGAIENTIMALISKEIPVRHFDIHVPIVYNKKLFPKIMDGYDWGIRDGYTIKSLYCNTLYLPAFELKDCNINHVCNTVDEIKQLVGDRWLFSTGPKGFNDVVMGFLDQLLSEVSETIEN